MDIDLAGKVAAEDILAEKPGRLKFADTPAQIGCRLLVAAPDKDKGVAHADGIRCQDDAFEQQVGVGLQQHPVLVGARLHLVAVADQPARSG